MATLGCTLKVPIHALPPVSLASLLSRIWVPCMACFSAAVLQALSSLWVITVSNICGVQGGRSRPCRADLRVHRRASASVSA